MALLDRVFDKFAARYEAMGAGRSKTFPGALEVLERLSREGVGLDRRVLLAREHDHGDIAQRAEVGGSVLGFAANQQAEQRCKMKLGIT